MADQSSELNHNEVYRPGVDDWRHQVVIAPGAGQPIYPGHAGSLEEVLMISAVSLRGLRVTYLADTDNLLIDFYTGGGSEDSVIHQSVGEICAALREAQLSGTEFVTMQMSRAFDLEFYGEDHLTSEQCFVGDRANDSYRQFHDAYESLDGI